MTIVGRRELADSETPTHAELDLSRLDEHVLGIRIWVRHRAELNRIKSLLNLDLNARVEEDLVAYHCGGKPPPRENRPDPWTVAAGMAFRDPGSPASRKRRLGPDTAIVCLALFFLSHRGGGSRSIPEAADLIAAAETDVDARHYIGSGDEWQRAYLRYIEDIERRLGPLG